MLSQLKQLMIPAFPYCFEQILHMPVRVFLREGGGGGGMFRFSTRWDEVGCGDSGGDRSMVLIVFFLNGVRFS
jgi:hypothetical protein